MIDPSFFVAKTCRLNRRSKNLCQICFREVSAEGSARAKKKRAQKAHAHKALIYKRSIFALIVTLICFN